MNLYTMDNLHLIQLNQYERPSIVEERNRNWVSIGDDNNYYQCLIDAYMDSTTNQAVINGIVNQIYGKGIDATDSSEKPEQYAQMKSLIKPNDLRNVCQDLKLLGEASFQITYTGNKISAITHFPRETLRAEKMNDKGEVKNYFYAPDWSKVNRNTKLKKFLLMIIRYKPPLNQAQKTTAPIPGAVIFYKVPNKDYILSYFFIHFNPDGCSIYANTTLPCQYLPADKNIAYH